MAGTGGKKARILVVDDDSSVVYMLKELLTSAGHDPTAVVDPEEALSVLSRESFDLVLTDIRMPRITGQQILVEARRMRPDVPVILMTGYKSDESVLDAFREGAVSYLTKPFTPEDLERAVRAALAVPGGVGAAGIEVAVPKRGWIELTAPSHQEFLRRFQTFSRLLYETELDEETKRSIQLAVEEIGTNAVEWGNRADTSRRIRITFCILEDAVSFKIEDEGGGFRPRRVAPASPEEAFLEILSRIGGEKRAGGLGIRFVREVMDDVIYSDRGNAVLLTKWLSRGEKGQREPAGGKEGTGSS
ncbi:MAG: response regulator [Planctomycetes bacterium]|nr:response regulator [Planctomycetota bacterium]